MNATRRNLWVFGLGLWCAATALVAACGSTDSTKTPRKDPPSTDGGGGSNDGAAGDGAILPTGAKPNGGAGGAPIAEPNGGAGAAATPGDGGSESVGGASGGAGPLASAGGEGGSGGEGGEPASCSSLDPIELEGLWGSNCNGYTCRLYVTPSGEFGNGCTNGQFETGTIEGGKINSLGEGGPYAPYSTKGTLTREGCENLRRDYVGQIPPNTGPEMSYSCLMTRQTACAPTLLEALEGSWETTCGSSTCVTTFTAEGAMASTCSNGQASTGAVEETGAFADEGGGGGFQDYSTTGVIGLTDCDNFIMPYTWQMPPHTGNKTSAQCTYKRVVDN